MRKKYSTKNVFSHSSLRIRHFFQRLGLKWRRMRPRKKYSIISVTAGVVAGVFLFSIFVIRPAVVQGGALPQAESEAAEMTDVPAEPTPAPTPTPPPTPTPDPTLMPGMESPEVTKLQQRLLDLGYLDIDETTQLYGPATTTAVNFFQRQHGIQQDGICGPDTLVKIYAADAQPYMLLQGTEGDDVDLLQQRLEELGYLSKSTGYYGTETIDAVMAFQERNDIGVDGKTGPVTLDRIYSADAVPTEAKANQARRRGNILNFLESAENQLGEPYVWGASGPNSFDCSGLVTYCLREAGSTTGRLNAAGFSTNSRWEKITDIDDMEIGDLIFFNSGGSRISHTGIYIGDGMMIDASSANGKVVKRSCMTDYWRSHFVNARRPW